MPAVTVRAPAKVNLALSVGPRRPDGFHEIATIYHAVTLFDEVAARPADRVTVSVKGTDGVPIDETNLAVQAARTLAAYAGVTAGVRLAIRKRIPVAAGLAGGSTDAAAALVACDALWGTGLGRPELSVLAGRLGSDVPFALAGGTALGTGRGEQLTPVMVGGTFHWVLAFAAGTLSTPEVFAELDRRRGAKVRAPAVASDLLAALRSADAAALGRLLSNDLQDAACALAAGLTGGLEAGLSLGALGAVICGSGPTCAFLAAGPQQAQDLAAALVAFGAFPHALSVTGPAPGARLVV